MLSSFLFSVMIAALLGFLSGMGIGGGSLLILWLTVAHNMAPPEARILNLLFFIPCALVACVFRWRQGVLQIRKLLPAILSGCLFAYWATQWGEYLELSLLKKLFGGLLIITGIRELRYKPKAGP